MADWPAEHTNPENDPAALRYELDGCRAAVTALDPTRAAYRAANPERSPWRSAITKAAPQLAVAAIQAIDNAARLVTYNEILRALDLFYKGHQLHVIADRLRATADRLDQHQADIDGETIRWADITCPDWRETA